MRISTTQIYQGKFQARTAAHKHTQRMRTSKGARPYAGVLSVHLSYLHITSIAKKGLLAAQRADLKMGEKEI
jgi:hypothetical protein